VQIAVSMHLVSKLAYTKNCRNLIQMQNYFNLNKAFEKIERLVFVQKLKYLKCLSRLFGIFTLFCSDFSNALQK